MCSLLLPPVNEWCIISSKCLLKGHMDRMFQVKQELDEEASLAAQLL